MTDGQSQAAPSATPAQGAPPSAPAAAPAAANNQPAADGRPAYVPEKFWNPETKGVKTEDAFKSYTELEKKLREPRYDVPAADVPPEARTAWEDNVFKAFGVPETPDGYGIEVADDAEKETVGAFATKMHSLKMNPAQVNGVVEWLKEQAGSINDVEIQEETDRSARLDGFYTKTFGDQKVAVVERVKTALAEAIPDSATRADIEKSLPPEALNAIGAIHEHYRKTYGLADQTQGDQGGNAGKSPEDLRTDAKAMMASEAYRDPMHKDHKSTKDKVNQAYRDIDALTKATVKK